MTPTIKHVLATLAVIVVGAAVAFALFVGSGAYNFAADEPHTGAVSSLLEIMRERSIKTRAAALQAPDLSETTRIVQGAGNYNAMCVGCHLAPGMSESELSKGLYPAPPNLSKVKVDPIEAFWVIKHGIKASGMPAWGKSMSDEYVWNMTAFLQELPKLDTDRYKEMVAYSGGHRHDHGGDHDEDADHGSHEHGAEASHHDQGDEKMGAMTEPMPGASATAGHPHEAGVKAAEVHVHADGSQHVHKTQGERK